MDAHQRVIEESTATLDGVDLALERLSAGTYRTCEACGAELDDELLAPSPTRRHCEAHEGAATTL